MIKTSHYNKSLFSGLISHIHFGEASINQVSKAELTQENIIEVDTNLFTRTVGQFNGVNSQIAAEEDLNFQEFAISLWLKPEATQKNYAVIVCNGHDGGENAKSWVIQQSGNEQNTYYFWQGHPTITSFDKSAIKFKLHAGHWQHLVLNRHSDGAIELYLNGNLISHAKLHDEIIYSESKLMLGNWRHGSREWKGEMHDFYFYNRILKPTEILSLRFLGLHYKPLRAPTFTIETVILNNGIESNRVIFENAELTDKEINFIEQHILTHSRYHAINIHEMIFDRCHVTNTALTPLTNFLQSLSEIDTFASIKFKDLTFPPDDEEFLFELESNSKVSTSQHGYDPDIAIANLFLQNKITKRDLTELESNLLEIRTRLADTFHRIKDEDSLLKIDINDPIKLNSVNAVLGQQPIQGWRLIHLALWYGALSIYEKLATDPNLDYSVSIDEWSPLHVVIASPFLVETESLYLMEQLINKGCSLLDTTETRDNVLHLAAALGKINIITELMDEPEFNSWLTQSNLNLHRPYDVAKYNGHEAAYQLLMQKTILHLVKQNEFALVNTILETHSADSPQLLEIYQQALFQALELNHQEMVRAILEVDEQLLLSKDANDQTLLHWVAQGYCTEVYEKLSSSAHFEELQCSQNKQGQTPLMLAIAYQQYGMIDTLFKAFLTITSIPDSAHKDHEGYTLRHYFAHHSKSADNQRNLLNYLGQLNKKKEYSRELTTSEGQTALEVAIRYSNLNFVKADTSLATSHCSFLAKLTKRAILWGSDVSVLSHIIGVMQEKYPQDWFASLRGQSLLHACVKTNNLGMLRYLLEIYGESFPQFVNEVDDKQRKLLHYAAAKGYIEIVDYLLRTTHLDVSVNDEDSHQKTPIYWSIEAKQNEMTQFLCAKGADLHEKPIRMRNGEIEYYTARRFAGKFYQQDELSYADVHHTVKECLHSNNIPVALRHYRKTPTNLVFQGGGAKLVSYLGFVQAFERVNGFEKIDRLAGTSAGAIISSLLAVGFRSAELDDFKNMQLTDFIVPTKAEVSSTLISSIWQFFRNNLLGFYKAYQGDYTSILRAFGKKAAALDTRGLSSGDKLRDFLEEKIYQKTGIANCTFGEYRELRKANPSQFKHIYVVATDIMQNTLVEFTSELKDTSSLSKNPYDDVVIADAVTASGSFPFVFKPRNVRYKRKDLRGNVYFETDSHQFCDGGIIRNFPMNIFDWQQFNPVFDATQHHRREKFHNPYTLGVSLVSSAPVDPETIEPSNITNIAGLVWAIGMVYFAAEKHQSSLDRYSASRVIDLPTEISTLALSISDDAKEHNIKKAYDATLEWLGENSFEAIRLDDSNSVLLGDTGSVTQPASVPVSSSSRLMPPWYSPGMLLLNSLQQTWMLSQSLNHYILGFEAVENRLNANTGVNSQALAIVSSEESLQTTVTSTDTDTTTSPIAVGFFTAGQQHNDTSMLFDYGQWDNEVKYHPQTREPIFTYRVFLQGEETGTMEFYKHPMPCRSEAGDRHNMLVTTGIFSGLEVEIQSIEDICAALPPTYWQSLVDSSQRSAIHAGTRSAGTLVGYALGKRGVSQMTAKVAEQATYYGLYFATAFYDNSDNLDGSWSSTLEVLTQSICQTAWLATINIGLNAGEYLLDTLGKKAIDAGYIRTGQALSTISHWVPYTSFMYNANVQGVATAASSLATGVIVSQALELGGKAIVDRFVI